MITLSWISAFSREVMGLKSLKRVFNRFPFLVPRKFLKEVILLHINFFCMIVFYNYTHIYLYNRIKFNKKLFN